MRGGGVVVVAGVSRWGMKGRREKRRGRDDGDV